MNSNTVTAAGTVEFISNSSTSINALFDCGLSTFYSNDCITTNYSGRIDIGAFIANHDLTLSGPSGCSIYGLCYSNRTLTFNGNQAIDGVVVCTDVAASSNTLNGPATITYDPKELPAKCPLGVTGLVCSKIPGTWEEY